ncbi:MAG: flagellar hook-length control protein FliK [Candidatus Ozemobacteraceae bacterium]
MIDPIIGQLQSVVSRNTTPALGNSMNTGVSDFGSLFQSYLSGNASSEISAMNRNSSFSTPRTSLESLQRPNPLPTKPSKPSIANNRLKTASQAKPKKADAANANKIQKTPSLGPRMTAEQLDQIRESAKQAREKLGANSVNDRHALLEMLRKDEKTGAFWSSLNDETAGKLLDQIEENPEALSAGILQTGLSEKGDLTTVESSREEEEKATETSESKALSAEETSAILAALTKLPSQNPSSENERFAEMENTRPKAAPANGKCHDEAFSGGEIEKKLIVSTGSDNESAKEPGVEEAIAKNSSEEALKTKSGQKEIKKGSEKTEVVSEEITAAMNADPDASSVEVMAAKNPTTGDGETLREKAQESAREASPVMNDSSTTPETQSATTSLPLEVELPPQIASNVSQTSSSKADSVESRLNKVGHADIKSAIGAEKPGDRQPSNNSGGSTPNGFGQSNGQSQTLTGASSKRELSGQSENIRGSLFSQLVEKAHLLVGPQAQKVLTMQLKPEFLGKVDMFLTSKDGTVSARILTDNPAVRDQLEAIAPQIKQHLADLGVILQQLTVDISSKQPDDNRDKSFSRDGREGGRNKVTRATGESAVDAVPESEIPGGTAGNQSIDITI